MASNAKNIAELLNNQTTIATADIADGAIATAKLADGAITNAKVNSAAAIQTSKLTGLDGELLGVKQDLALVAFDSIQADNRSAFSTSNSFVDQYEDSTKIANLSNVERSSAEYITSYNQGNRTFKDLQVELFPGKGNMTLDTWDTGNAYDTNWANDSLSKPTGTYSYGIVNYLFDLAYDFQINVYSRVLTTGDLSGTAYGAYSGFITTDTSIAAGKNPGIFTTISGNSNQTYGSISPTDFNSNNLNSTGQAAFNLSNAGYGNNSTIGNQGAISANANDANYAFSTYLNQGSGARGFRVNYTTSNDTLTVHYLNNGDQSQVRTDVTRHTITNVPHTGRFFFAFGEATTSITADRRWSLSTATDADGTRSNAWGGIANATGNYQCTAQTASSSTTKVSAVVMYKDQAGTNALNSDLVIQLSADNGSNFTTATLVAAPNLTSDTKVAKTAQITVTAGTQIKYKVILANQSASKQCRVLGVALQY